MSDELAALVTMETSEEAAMLREMLENEGILTVVAGELDPFLGKLSSLGVTVSVRATDVERAREIYQAFFDAEIPEPDEDNESSSD